MTTILLKSQCVLVDLLYIAPEYLEKIFDIILRILSWSWLFLTIRWQHCPHSVHTEALTAHWCGTRQYKSWMGKVLHTGCVIISALMFMDEKYTQHCSVAECPNKVVINMPVLQQALFKRPCLLKEKPWTH